MGILLIIALEYITWTHLSVTPNFCSGIKVLIGEIFYCYECYTRENNPNS